MRYSLFHLVARLIDFRSAIIELLRILILLVDRLMLLTSTQKLQWLVICGKKELHLAAQASVTLTSYRFASLNNLYPRYYADF